MQHQITSVAEVFEHFPAISSMDYSLGEVNEMAKQWSKHYPKYLYGLYQHGITFKVHREEMIYFGGDKAKHEEYFLEMCSKHGLDPTIIKPNHKENCICGVKIEENCYIVYEDIAINPKKTKLVIGNCCIQRYITSEKRSKICFNCDKRHTNYKSNFCDSCRKVCSQCGETKHNVVERGLCIMCKNETQRLKEEEEHLQMIRRINEQNRLQREQERLERARKYAEEQREKAEQQKKEAEKERIIAEVRRRDMEEQRAIEEYTRKNKCDCGALIKGPYRQCADCFKKMKKCSRVGCNTKISNPKYQVCYKCSHP
jgi:hypothetical protein